MKNVISVFLLVVITSGCIAQSHQRTSEKHVSAPQKNGQTYQSQNGNGQPYLDQNIREMLPIRSVGHESVVYPSPGGNKPNTLHIRTQCIDNRYSEDSKAINAPIRQFALDLLSDVVRTRPERNIILSTFSVWSVLLMILEGSDGETARQIRQTLVLSEDERKVRCNFIKLSDALKISGKSLKFDSSNAIFHDINLPTKKDFEDVVSRDYEATIRPLNYSNPRQALNDINEWVSNTTHERIKTLLQEDDLKTPGVIIANTVYFKGAWKHPFNITATFKDKFYNEKREQIGTVQMMYQKSELLYSYVAEIQAHILDMPYADGKFRMLIILPKVGVKLENVLGAMKMFPVDACYDRLVKDQETFSDSVVHVYLPRFKYRTKVVLNDNLKRLNITDVFDATRANLTRLNDGVSHLSKLVHIAEIEVNEEGTTASGATGGVFVNRGAPPKFIANRPFAYFIVEESQKSVIFAGKIHNPSPTNQLYKAK